MSRFRLPADGVAFATRAQAALAAFALRPGYVSGVLGRNLDDPDLWVLTTTWADVGSYRRALAAYEVKLALGPLQVGALDEPSAYEIVEPGRPTNEQVPRALG